MSEIAIRPEQRGDWDLIPRVHGSAFATSAEADLVAKLQSNVPTRTSIVATVDDAIVGHVLFTTVDILDDERPATALALGPLAVLPEHQNRGIGSALVREGLRTCEGGHEHVIFVLGHATYYPRFGFEPAWPKGLYFGPREPNPSFFVIELAPDALEGRRGEVRYHQAFYEM